MAIFFIKAIHDRRCRKPLKKDLYVQADELKPKSHSARLKRHWNKFMHKISGTRDRFKIEEH